MEDDGTCNMLEVLLRARAYRADGRHQCARVVIAKARLRMLRGGIERREEGLLLHRPRGVEARDEQVGHGKGVGALAAVLEAVVHADAREQRVIEHREGEVAERQQDLGPQHAERTVRGARNHEHGVVHPLEPARVVLDQLPVRVRLNKATEEATAEVREQAAAEEAEEAAAREHTMGARPGPAEMTVRSSVT